MVTDDTIRSLAISQRLLGTKEIVLIHHTDCGMLTFTDEDFAATLEDDTGEKPAWTAQRSPTCGFVFDVATGRLDEVGLSRDPRETHGPGDLIRRRAKIIGPCDAADPGNSSRVSPTDPGV